MEETKYYLIINTNSYAGNFERELCAHLTGHVGECEVGSRLVDKDVHKIFEPYIGEGFEDGCWRPVEMFRDFDDNGAYNSLRISLNEPLPIELTQIIKDRCETYNDAEGHNGLHSSIEIKGIKLMTEKITTKQEIQEI